MDGLSHVLAELRQLLDRHSAAASAVLMAFAVERGLISDAQARQWAEQLDLSDLERVKSMLALHVQRAGRQAELVSLVQSLRHIQRRSDEILRSAAPKPS